MNPFLLDRFEAFAVLAKAPPELILEAWSEPPPTPPPPPPPPRPPPPPPPSPISLPPLSEFKALVFSGIFAYTREELYDAINKKNDKIPLTVAEVMQRLDIKSKGRKGVSIKVGLLLNKLGFYSAPRRAFNKRSIRPFLRIGRVL